jgi:dCMP deaminase
MRQVPKWDEYFLGMAEYCSIRSKDPNTQVGAVIVGPEHEVRSTGYNGLPAGVDDTILERYERPEKYFWIEHAERNAIYNAAKVLKDCTLYCQWIPCIDCARACVQAGIKRIVVDKREGTKWESNPQWVEGMKRSRQLFKEANVELVVWSKDDNA